MVPKTHDRKSLLEDLLSSSKNDLRMLASQESKQVSCEEVFRSPSLLNTEIAEVLRKTPQLEPVALVRDVVKKVVNFVCDHKVCYSDQSTDKLTHSTYRYSFA